MKRFFRLLFEPCEGITSLVSKSFDLDLTRTERFAVRLHFLYCVACRRFRRQVKQIRRMFDVDHEAMIGAPELKLSPDARARMTDLLKS